MGFFPDLAAADAIDRAESDPEQAAEVLRLAAAYMRRGEALPYNLAEYLADAIEASMGKPESHRGGALLEELNLKARNRRPAAYWLDVGEYMDELIHRGASQNAAAIEAADKFDISETTARNYLRRYQQDIQEQAQEEAHWHMAELERENGTDAG